MTLVASFLASRRSTPERLPTGNAVDRNTASPGGPLLAYLANYSEWLGGAPTEKAGLS